MTTGSRSLYQGSDAVFLHDCDVCLVQDMTSEAISYCTLCCEHLCQSCDKAHRGSRATRDHTLLTGSNIPSGSRKTIPTLPIMFCDIHKTTRLDLYCNTHDEVICTTCKLGTHTTCDTVDVSRHTTKINVATSFRAVEKILDDLKTRFDDLKKSRKADLSTMKAQTQKCLHDMQQLRKSINDTLDKLEKKISSEIHDIEQRSTKEINNHLITADDVTRKIENLKTTLNECKKVRTDDVMFVGKCKSSSRAREYDKIFDNIQNEIYEIDIRFQPDDVITNVLSLQSLGTVVVNKQPKYSSPIPPSVLNMSVADKQTKYSYPIPLPVRIMSAVEKQTKYSHPIAPSVLNMSAVDKQKIDVCSRTISGCTFMSDGHFVLSRGNDGLQLFDENFKYKSQLSVCSIDVSAINDTDVIVTQIVRQQLQRVRVLPDMEMKRTLMMDRKCWGVDVYGGEIYVTCHDAPGNGEVRVLNMDGQVQRRLGVDNGKYRFKWPNFVRVNRDGSKVFVSDWDTNIVTCLNKQGHVIYQYSDRDLKSPVGMYVDGENNLLVCGWDSNNVHVVRQDGSKEKIMLSEKDGIRYPLCISYRQSDGCMVVGLNNHAKTDKKLVIFRMT